MKLPARTARRRGGLRAGPRILLQGKAMRHAGPLRRLQLLPSKNPAPWATLTPSRSRSGAGRPPQKLRNYGEETRHYTRCRGSTAALMKYRPPSCARSCPIWTPGTPRAACAAYDQALADLPIDLPPRTPWAESNRHLYPIRTSDRDALQAHLPRRGNSDAHSLIRAGSPPTGLRGSGLRPRRLSLGRGRLRAVLSLPLYPELPRITRIVIAALRQFFA